MYNILLLLVSDFCTVVGDVWLTNVTVDKGSMMGDCLSAMSGGLLTSRRGPGILHRHEDTQNCESTTGMNKFLDSLLLR